MKQLVYLFSVVVLFFSCDGDGDRKNKREQTSDTAAAVYSSPELAEVSSRLIQSPDNAELYNERAKIYFQQKQFEQAINDTKRAISLDSSKADFYLTLVDVYFAQNNTRQAKDLLISIEKKFPRNTEALLKLAELYWLVRHYQEGIDYVNKALRIDQHLAKGYYIKGGIYRESGDTTRAVSSLVTATEQDNRFVEAFYDLGVIYGARKNPLALQYFENVLRIDPSHAEAKYGRAKLLQDLGRIDEAVQAYEQIIASDAECSQCHYNVGAIYLELKNRPEVALEHFSKAINIDPAYTLAYFARGYTYTKLNDIKSARADYKMCLNLEPGFEPAIEGLNALD